MGNLLHVIKRTNDPSYFGGVDFGAIFLSRPGSLVRVTLIAISWFREMYLFYYINRQNVVSYAAPKQTACSRPGS